MPLQRKPDYTNLPNLADTQVNRSSAYDCLIALAVTRCL